MNFIQLQYDVLELWYDFCKHPSTIPFSLRVPEVLHPLGYISLSMERMGEASLGWRT